MSTSVRLSPEYEARLNRLAESTGRSKSFYIKEAITSAMDKFEYEYGILKDAEDYRAGRLETSSLAEVRERLGHS